MVVSSPVYENTEIALDNGTGFTFNNDTMQDNVEYLHDEILRMMKVCAKPPIILLGSFGNLLTFIVMRRGSLKHVSTCFYMAILGLADTGECCLLFLYL